MMDHIPPIKPNRNSAVEHAAHLKDIRDRERAARPVEQGRDILEHRPVDGMDERFGFAADSDYLRY